MLCANGDRAAISSDARWKARRVPQSASFLAAYSLAGTAAAKVALTECGNPAK